MNDRSERNIQEEKILWSGQPDATWFQYRQYKPLNAIPTAHANYFNIVIVVGALILVFLIFAAFTVGSISDDDLQWLGVVWISLSIIIGVLMYLGSKYIFRPEQLLFSQYIVTNQRVSWQYVLATDTQVQHYIKLEQLIEVILRQHGDLEVIEWRQDIPANLKHNEIHPNAVEKIIFVGVDNAQALIKLVEETRGKLLPLTDLRHEGSKKKSIK